MPKYTERQIQIINAAIEIIAARSMQDLTTTNLASKIGLSEAALYRHFDSKVQILYAILDYFGAQKKELFAEIIASKASAVKKIETIFQQHFETFTLQPAMAAVIFSEEIFQNEHSLAKKILEIMNCARDAFHEILTNSEDLGSLRDDISPQHLTMIIMGSLRLIVTRWHLSKHSFNLEEEGSKLWNSMRILITKPKTY